LYFVAHTGQSEEDAVEVAADADVGIADGAEDAATFELVEGDACPAEEEEDEDDVAQTVYPMSVHCVSLSLSGRIHIDVQGDELAISGALPRIERIA
jgi:hypothetical protein